MEYPPFFVTSDIDGTRHECRFRNLITGISPRHSDTVDVQFLVDGRLTVVALSLPAFEEQRKLSGEALTDREVMHIAALSLQDAIVKEGFGEDRCVVPSGAEILALAAKVRALVHR